MGAETANARLVTVEVFAYAPTIFTHCQHCEVAFGAVGIGERIQRREAASALPPDLLAEYQQVSDWVHALLERHGGAVAIKVVDPASFEGFWRSLWRGVRRFPSVVVDGEAKVVGTDFTAADLLIDERLAAGAAKGRGDA